VGAVEDLANADDSKVESGQSITVIGKSAAERAGILTDCDRVCDKCA
jgi:hypothetical protein